VQSSNRSNFTIKMSGLLDNLNVRCGDCMEGERRNSIASIVAGVFFFTGWWIILDIAALAPPTFHGTYYLCGIFGTVALFMINVISNAQLWGDAFTEGCMGPRGARMWLFVGFVMGFASLIASAWIMFEVFVIPDKNDKWPGTALLLQNLFIFFSSLVYKFGRSEDLWG